MKIKKLLFLSLTIICVLSVQLSAFAQPPDYDDYADAKVYDATVSGNKASISLVCKAGETEIINVPLTLNGDTGLVQLIMKMKNDASGTITITAIDQPSQNTLAGVGYFKIDMEGIDDEDLSGAEFIFKVKNELVSVQLYRLSAGTWTALSTSRVEAGANESTYKATSPGFSEFAIVAQQGSVQSTSTGKLPFTGGTPLYLVGGLGLILIASGLALRVKGVK